jgi:hypothetical protein
MALKRELKRGRALAFLAAFAVAGLLAHPRPGFAHSGTAEEQTACTPDVLSLCFWDIASGEDRIVACLNKNLDRLSPACHKVIAGDDEPQKQKKTDSSKH